MKSSRMAKRSTRSSRSLTRMTQEVERASQARSSPNHSGRSSCTSESNVEQKISPPVESMVANRPKRQIIPKKRDDSSGLSWREETDLKKALYLSLQESRRQSRDETGQGTADMELLPPPTKRSFTAVRPGTSGLAEKRGTRDNLRLLMPVKWTSRALTNVCSGPSTTTTTPLVTDESSRDSQTQRSVYRTKIHAQRKFAQGSRPGSPTHTPVKSVSTPKRLFSGVKNVKTEDFLTFLCLRGTSALPPHMNYLSKGETEGGDPSPPATPCRSASSSRPATPSSTHSRNGASRGCSGSQGRKRNGQGRSQDIADDLGVKPLPKESPTKSPPKRRAEATKSSSRASPSRKYRHSHSRDDPSGSRSAEGRSKEARSVTRKILREKERAGKKVREKLLSVSSSARRGPTGSAQMAGQRLVAKAKAQASQPVRSGKQRVTRSMAMQKKAKKAEQRRVARAERKKKVDERSPPEGVKEQEKEEQTKSSKTEEEAMQTRQSQRPATRLRHKSHDQEVKMIPRPKTRRSRGSSSQGSSVSDKQVYILEAPVYYPSEEQFQDPIAYFDSISSDAEQFGMCRVVPPDGYKPEPRLTMLEKSSFPTLVQHVHKLQDRWSPSSIQLECIRQHLLTQDIKLDHHPTIGGMEMDLPKLSQTIKKLGGIQTVIGKNKWNRVADDLKIPKSAPDRISKLYDVYCRYLLPYDTLSADEKQKLEQQMIDRQKQKQTPPSCVMKGRSKKIGEFQRAAKNFQSMYFKEDATVEHIENEYWRYLTEGREHVCVRCGKVETPTIGGSLFPTSKSSPWARHGWNFHILANSYPNVLRYCNTSDIGNPSVQMGMVFSASCLSQEPLCLPRIHYLHSGSSMVWYSIPGDEERKVMDMIQQNFPDIVPPDSPLQRKHSIMISPSKLVSNGIRLCRNVQEEGEFIVIFPRAHSCNISCGFTVSESLNFAPSSWLPVGVHSLQEVRERGDSEPMSLEQALITLAYYNKTPRHLLQDALPHLQDLIVREQDLRQKLSDLGLKSVEKVAGGVTSVSKRGRPSEVVPPQRCPVTDKLCPLSVVHNSQEDCFYSLEAAITHLQRRKNLRYCQLLVRYTEEDLQNIITHVKEKLSV